MAHHYAIRTFDETAPVVRGGVTAAYEAAGNTLATVVPPDWRLIQLIETGRADRARRGDRVVRRAAPGGLEPPSPARRVSYRAGEPTGEAARRAQRGGWALKRDGHGHEHVERGPLQEPADPAPPGRPGPRMSAVPDHAGKQHSR